jgi:hypothetical protein
MFTLFILFRLAPHTPIGSAEYSIIPHCRVELQVNVTIRLDLLVLVREEVPAIQLTE